MCHVLQACRFVIPASDIVVGQGGVYVRRTPSRNICEQDNALPTLTRQERTPDRKWTSHRRPTRTECRLVSRENMNLQSSKYVHPRGSVSSPIKKRITRLLPGRFACFATIAIDWNVGRIAFSVGAQFCGQRVRECGFCSPQEATEIQSQP